LIDYLTIEKALEIAKLKSKKRFPHVLGTYKKAIELANQYNINEKKVSIAAILHDYAKNEPLDKMEMLLETIDPDLIQYNSVVYHGVVGSYLLQNKLKITDKDILLAVKNHVTGHPDMNDIAKIVYIADYTEDNRTHDGVDFCRYASKLSLDIGVLAISEAIFHYLHKISKKKIHPLTEATYHHFLQKVGVKSYEIIKNNYQSM
jgi:predicted HD superfamily hydrolase involved in NAD metabolism